MKSNKFLNKYFKNSLSSKAVTLVELLVVVGISVSILASVMIIDLLVRRTFAFNSSFLSVHGQARSAMDWLSRDIRWASQIKTDVVIDSVTYLTGDDELVLEIPSIDSSGDVISGTVDYVVYHLDDGDSSILYRIVDADDTSSRAEGTKKISIAIDELEFSSDGTGLSSVADVTALTKVDIDLQTSQLASNGETARELLSSTIKLRNN